MQIIRAPFIDKCFTLQWAIDVQMYAANNLNTHAHAYTHTHTHTHTAFGVCTRNRR